MTKILEILYRHQDKNYVDFISKLIPNVPKENFIGIRSPEYKKIMKEIENEAASEISTFMEQLPHQFHEENVLHITYICKMKDYDECICALEKFLPYVNNWAISDVINAKSLEKNKDKLITKIEKWIKDDAPYTKRVAMILLMKFYLKEDFKVEYLQWAAQIQSEDYYVKMMIAWLFAEALATQWDEALKFIKQNKLEKWTHNKAIQKAKESRKITIEQKEFLQTLKVK